MTRRDELDAFLDDEAAADPAFAAELGDADRRHTLLVDCIAARKRAGLTQKAVAAAMETTQSSVSEFESGDDPRLSTIQRYARAVGREFSFTLVEESYVGSVNVALGAVDWASLGITFGSYKKVKHGDSDWTHFRPAARIRASMHPVVTVTVGDEDPVPSYKQEPPTLSLVRTPAA